MSLRWNQRYRCDNCGEFNPKVVPGGRIAICCTVKGGMYTVPDEFRPAHLKGKQRVGSNGKRTVVYLQFPIAIDWLGFWTYFRPPSKEEKARRKHSAAMKKKFS